MSNAASDKEKDNNVFINCSNIETSALKWSFIDKIMNKIDEIEAKEIFCNDSIQLYEKAGFIYFLDAKSKELKESSNIEIPLISDNDYLCCLSKLFSNKPTNIKKEVAPSKPKPPETKLIDSFFNLATSVDNIIDEIKAKDCESILKEKTVKEEVKEVKVEPKAEEKVNEVETEQIEELVLPSSIPETSGDNTDIETVATFGSTEDSEDNKNEKDTI